MAQLMLVIFGLTLPGYRYHGKVVTTGFWGWLRRKPKCVLDRTMMDQPALLPYDTWVL